MQVEGRKRMSCGNANRADESLTRSYLNFLPPLPLFFLIKEKLEL